MSSENRLVEHPRPLYAWAVFILSVIFSAYSVILQLSPTIENIVGNDMSRITGMVYAMTAFYYTFAIFQVPIGILIDRYGSRFLPSIGILLCAIGSITMSRAEFNWEIAISRGVIGLGATFAFLNGVRIINNWFQPKRFSYLLGLFIGLTALAIVLLKAGFNHLEKTLQWHGALMTFGLGGLIFACIYFFVVQDSPGAGFTIYSKITDRKQFWKNIGHVFNSPHVWVVGVAVGLMIGPIFAFQTLWSIPFLKTVYEVPTPIAMMFNLLFMFGYASGAVFFGRVSTSLGKRKIFVTWGIAVALMMIIIILYPPYLGIQITSICFFILGFGASNINIGYTIVHEHNVPQVTATSVAVVNTFYAFFAAISQSLIAIFLNLGTQLQHTEGFTTRQFQVSLIRLPIYLFIALIFSFLIKETYCNQRQSYED